MKMKAMLTVGAAISMAASSVVTAQDRTFRTTASIAGVFQEPNLADTNDEILVTIPLAGHNLVSYALGTTNNMSATDVLALEINCGSTQASLVVFDKTLNSNVVTIATSTQLTALTGQDNINLPGPGHERFVAQMTIGANGYLVGGSLTVTGRIYLDPATGCPRAVLADTDRGSDRLFADAAVKDTDDAKDKDKSISGEAHLIGVVNMFFSDGLVHTVLVPLGHLTMRRQLLP